jgi:hypothetical protein
MSRRTEARVRPTFKNKAKYGCSAPLSALAGVERGGGDRGWCEEAAQPQSKGASH